MKYIRNPNKIQLSKLAEMSVAALRQLDVSFKFYADQPENVKEHLGWLYEIEYKYNMLKDKPFTGLSKRKDNILMILDKKGREVVKPIADSFILVFENWLEFHALSDPAKWAEKRLEGDSDIGGDIYNFEILLRDFIRDYRQHDLRAHEDTVMMKIITFCVEDYFPPFVLDEMVIRWGKFLLDEFNNFDGRKVDDFNKEHMKLFKTNFRSPEDVESFIGNRFTGYNDNFFFAFGRKEEADKQLIEYYWNEWTDRLLKEFLDEQGIDTDELMVTLYEKLLFPLWYGRWKAQGIDATRANVEKVYQQLLSIESMPLTKQFMILNIAKNTSHQTGSMIEYYADKFGVDEDDFEAMSSLDVDIWNEDLREIGVEI